MSAPRRFTVVVPVRTYQTFLVEAASPAGAKRKVSSWLNGLRDESDDLVLLDDIGQETSIPGTRYWTVTVEEVP